MRWLPNGYPAARSQALDAAFCAPAASGTELYRVLATVTRLFPTPQRPPSHLPAPLAARHPFRSNGRVARSGHAASDSEGAADVPVSGAAPGPPTLVTQVDLLARGRDGTRRLTLSLAA